MGGHQLIYIRLHPYFKISELTLDCCVEAEEYTAILNGLECRQAKRRLEPANVIYWFKNTRAAARRAEAKFAAGRLPLYLDMGHQLDYLFR
jgi:hypothetical protein